VASNLFVLQALHELGIDLKGDLSFETVVDEEFGGVNGTLAGRVMGYNADAAIISEASFLRVCLAQRGGRTAHITLRATGGILPEGDYPVGVVEQLRVLLNRIPDFAAQRKVSAEVHPCYASTADPVPVTVLKVSTGPFTMKEPMGIPEVCQIELFWQAMPGETQPDIEAEFHAWLDGVVESAPGVFPFKPSVEFPLRWLPGCALEKTEPLVVELAACAEQVLGRPSRIEGIEGPCDMYVFHEFGIPAVLWGARGGNTHGADEYVEIDSLVESTAALLVFVCRWCGVR
jgi:acetylornithine deacetylase